MRCRRKPRQVWPDLSQDDLDNSWPKAVDRIKPFHELHVRLQATGYFLVDTLDAGVHAVDQGELLLE
jgi:hypothetical protein